jgi:hypothetical protein
MYTLNNVFLPRYRLACQYEISTQSWSLHYFFCKGSASSLLNSQSLTTFYIHLFMELNVHVVKTASIIISVFKLISSDHDKLHKTDHNTVHSPWTVKILGSGTLKNFI